MTDLETALKNHDWSSEHGSTGWLTRPAVDKLMKENPDTATILWEQYCPWSSTNGGYIAWSKK